MRGAPAAAPAGEDVPAAWDRHSGPDDVRLRGPMCGAVGTVVRRFEAVCAGVEDGNYNHEPYGLFARDHGRNSELLAKVVARGNTVIAGHKWQRTR